MSEHVLQGFARRAFFRIRKRPFKLTCLNCFEKRQFRAVFAGDFRENPIDVGLIEFVRGQNLFHLLARVLIRFSDVESAFGNGFVGVHFVNGLESDDRHFHHIVVGLTGCEPLELQPRPADNAYDDIVGQRQKFQNFIGNARDKRNHHNSYRKLDAGIVRPAENVHCKPARKRQHDDADNHDKHHKSRAATLVNRGIFLHVFDGKFFVVFKGVYRLVFRPVIHEHAFHVGHAGTYRDVRHEDDKPYQPFDNAENDVAHAARKRIERGNFEK